MVPRALFVSNLFFNHDSEISKSFLQLLAMDVSARTTMKDAAKCDKRCEWQNSANQKKAERILHFPAPPESILSSERLHINVTKQVGIALACLVDVFVCQ